MRYSLIDVSVSKQLFESHGVNLTLNGMNCDSRKGRSMQYISSIGTYVSYSGMKNLLDDSSVLLKKLSSHYTKSKSSQLFSSLKIVAVSLPYFLS